jgi:hypothetical protein
MLLWCDATLQALTCGFRPFMVLCNMQQAVLRLLQDTDDTSRIAGLNVFIVVLAFHFGQDTTQQLGLDVDGEVA